MKARLPNREAADKSGRAPAFTLVEVIFAVAVFATGFAAIAALFTPVAKAIGDAAEYDAAVRAAEGVRLRLSALPFAAALALVQDERLANASEAGSENLSALYVDREGEVGIYDGRITPAGWYIDGPAGRRRMEDRERFFAVDVVRNGFLSPAGASDEAASMVAVTHHIRWPVQAIAAEGRLSGKGRPPAQTAYFNSWIAR